MKLLVRTDLRAALLALGLVAGGLLTLGAVAPAAAADEPREVKARALFTQGQYAQALELFSTLYAESADPVYLRNLGRCHQMLRAPEPAIDAFRGYLRRARKLRAGEREEIDGYIAEMESLKKAQAEAAAAAEAKPLPPAAPPVAAAPPAPALHATNKPGPVADEGGLFSRWWFWTGVGAVLLGGATVVYMTRPGRPTCPSGVLCP